MSVPNLEKITSYIIPVAKEKVIIDGVDYSKLVTSIKLGDKFFYSDGCSSCGSCDVCEATVLLQHEYDKIASMSEDQFNAEGFIFGPDGFDTKPFTRLKDGLYEEKHVINSNPISVWVFDFDPVIIYQPQRKIKSEDHMIERCTWAVVHNHKQENQFVTCAIWPVRSITCRMPHLRFNHSQQGSVSISLNQYGRNFILNCPVQFNPPTTEEAFEVNKKNRLEKLEYLKRCADDFHISTWLPEIIDYVKNTDFQNYEERLGKNIIPSVLHKRKLFQLPRGVAE